MTSQYIFAICSYRIIYICLTISQIIIQWSYKTRSNIQIIIYQIITSSKSTNRPITRSICFDSFYKYIYICRTIIITCIYIYILTAKSIIWCILIAICVFIIIVRSIYSSILFYYTSIYSIFIDYFIIWLTIFYTCKYLSSR